MINGCLGWGNPAAADNNGRHVRRERIDDNLAAYVFPKI